MNLTELVISVLPKVYVIVLLLAVAYLEWRRGDWIQAVRAVSLKELVPFVPAAVVFLLLTGLLVIYDAPVLDFIRSLPAPFRKAVADAGAFVGSHIRPWVFLLSWYAVGVVLRRRSWSLAAFGCLLSAVISAVISHPLKFIFLRARPSAGMGPHSFFHLEGLFRNDRAFQSFPSGDVVVVAGAVFFMIGLLKGKAWRWGLLLAPLATAFHRMAVNRHWPADTFFSLGLGALAATLLLSGARSEGFEKRE